MKRLKLILLLLSFCSNILIAQNKSQLLIDSFKLQLPKTTDTIRVKTLIELCNLTKKIDFFESLKYGNQAIELSRKINYSIGFAESNFEMGKVYAFISNYPIALDNYLIALKTFEDLNNQSGIAKVLGSLGNLYNSIGDYQKSLDYFLRANKIFEKLNDKTKIASTYGNIGIAYRGMGELDKALVYHQKSFEYIVALKNKDLMLSNYINIGNIYLDQKKQGEALNYYKNAFKLSDELDLEDQKATIYSCIGLVYLETVLNENYNLLNQLFKGNKVLALNAARLYTDSSIQIKTKLGKIASLPDKYFTLSQIDSILGNFKNSLVNFKKYKNINDSIYNLEKQRKINQAAMQFEFNKEIAITKAENDKKEIYQKNIRNLIGTVLLFLIIVSSVLLFQQKKIKKEKKKVEDEKVKNEKLLLNILPEEVANELKETGYSKAKSYESATVLFTDFKDFTVLGEKLSPEKLVNEINTYFSEFDNIIEKYNIEKIKTIGDAYLCAGGIPVANKTHHFDVVNAAIDIIKYIEKVKLEKTAKGEIAFDLRIGINTGPLVAGIIGVKKFAYDIWGDTVNTAARMEQNSEAGKINISGSTYELIKDGFKCHYRGKINAKNKGDIDMYFVEGLK